MKPIYFTVKDIVKIIEERRKRKDDARFAVTGWTGKGKSTLVAKILFRMPEERKFNPWKHQVYCREDVIELLKSQEDGICWDDEAIESSFNLDFQNRDQQALTKILTKYRSKRNTYFSVLPEFFTLNKNIRDLFFMHFHVIAKGIAVVHMPNVWTLYTRDKWDAQENSKVERVWVQMKMKNPSFKPPFHRLSTFRGYLFFNDLTPKQRELVEEVKSVKRAKGDEKDDTGVKKAFIDRVYDMLIEGKLSKSKLQALCLFEDKKYSSVNITLNRMLNDKGIEKTVKSYFNINEEKEQAKVQEEVTKHLPKIPGEEEIPSAEKLF